MALIDYVSSSGEFHDETNLNFEKTSHNTLSTHSLKPLIYYYSINGRWEQRELPIEINQMQIGTNPYECEIQIEDSEADKIQIKIRKIGDVWYFIESGKNDLMKVNGMKQRQAHLLPESSVIIQIGGITFIFSTKSDKLSINKNSDNTPLSGPPQEGEFSLTCAQKELRFPFYKLCLVGSNPLCEFFIKSEPFCGFITNYNKKLLFNSISMDKNTFITKDGLNITENTPLIPGSKIRIDTSEITVKLSKEFRFSKSFNLIPEKKEEYMMLLRIDGNGRPLNGYALPAPGKSIGIGRDSLHAGLVITGSNRVSRLHAQAIIYDKSILVIDKQATNGTFVNNVRIKKLLVHPGDLLRFGDCSFILCYMS